MRTLLSFDYGKEASVNPKQAPVAREFHIVIERDSDGWYVGTVPALRGCHTQAKSLDTLMLRVREAIDLCGAGSSTHRPALEGGAFGSGEPIHSWREAT